MEDLIVMFHDGCSECSQQLVNGVNFCYDCCYFEADWKKPDLSNSPPRQVDIIRAAVKERRESKRE